MCNHEKENIMEQTSTTRKTNKKAPVQKASSKKVEATDRVGGVRVAGRGSE
jgi:hypothetical protein